MIENPRPDAQSDALTMAWNFATEFYTGKIRNGHDIEDTSQLSGLIDENSKQVSLAYSRAVIGLAAAGPAVCLCACSAFGLGDEKVAIQNIVHDAIVAIPMVVSLMAIIGDAVYWTDVVTAAITASRARYVINQRLPKSS